MEQMNIMNSHVDETQDFVKTNIPTSIANKKDKQASFSDQLPSQATINLRNQGASSIQMHNLNHVHFDEEAVETALAISSLRSGKDLLDPYKDHPLYKSLIDEETPTVVVEQDSSSEDEEERVRDEPNPDTYKPPVPYPQELSKPDGELSQNMNTRVPSEPRYALRKRNHSQLQQKLYSSLLMSLRNSPSIKWMKKTSLKH